MPSNEDIITPEILIEEDARETPEQEEQNELEFLNKDLINRLQYGMPLACSDVAHWAQENIAAFRLGTKENAHTSSKLQRKKSHHQSEHGQMPAAKTVTFTEVIVKNYHRVYGRHASCMKTSFERCENPDLVLMQKPEWYPVVQKPRIRLISDKGYGTCGKIPLVHLTNEEACGISMCSHPGCWKYINSNEGAPYLQPTHKKCWPEEEINNYYQVESCLPTVSIQCPKNITTQTLTEACCKAIQRIIGKVASEPSIKSQLTPWHPKHGIYPCVYPSTCKFYPINGQDIVFPENTESTPTDKDVQESRLPNDNKQNPGRTKECAISCDETKLFNYADETDITKILSVCCRPLGTKLQNYQNEPHQGKQKLPIVTTNRTIKMIPDKKSKKACHHLPKIALEPQNSTIDDIVRSCKKTKTLIPLDTKISPKISISKPSEPDGDIYQEKSISDRASPTLSIGDLELSDEKCDSTQSESLSFPGMSHAALEKTKHDNFTAENNQRLTDNDVAETSNSKKHMDVAKEKEEQMIISSSRSDQNKLPPIGKPLSSSCILPLLDAKTGYHDTRHLPFPGEEMSITSSTDVERGSNVSIPTKPLPHVKHHAVQVLHHTRKYFSKKTTRRMMKTTVEGPRRTKSLLSPGSKVSNMLNSENVSLASLSSKRLKANQFEIGNKNLEKSSSAVNAFQTSKSHQTTLQLTKSNLHYSSSQNIHVKSVKSKQNADKFKIKSSSSILKNKESNQKFLKLDSSNTLNVRQVSFSSLESREKSKREDSNHDWLTKIDHTAISAQSSKFSFHALVRDESSPCSTADTLMESDSPETQSMEDGKLVQAESRPSIADYLNQFQAPSEEEHVLSVDVEEARIRLAASNMRTGEMARET